MKVGGEGGEGIVICRNCWAFVVGAISFWRVGVSGRKGPMKPGEVPRGRKNGHVTARVSGALG